VEQKGKLPKFRGRVRGGVAADLRSDGSGVRAAVEVGQGGTNSSSAIKCD